MKEANESKKRDEMVELAKHFIRKNIQKEFSNYVRGICKETGMTRNEVIASDVEVTILSNITHIVLNAELPESFWMKIYYRAKEGNVLNTVADNFKVKVVLELKDDTPIIIPKSDGGHTRAYA